MSDVSTIKNACEAQRLSLAAAESVTIGNIQAMIGAISGASTFFRGGVTAYDIDAKANILGVDRAHAETVDCVSARVAAEMAEGATRIFAADIAVATTGYAEPAGAEGPHAFYAIWDTARGTDNPVRADRLVATDRDRVAAQQFFAASVVRELAAYLTSRL
jgi:nicotinamide-nucleotide amidase